MLSFPFSLACHPRRVLQLEMSFTKVFQRLAGDQSRQEEDMGRVDGGKQIEPIMIMLSRQTLTALLG